MVWSQNLYEKIISKKPKKTKNRPFEVFVFKTKKQNLKTHLFYPLVPSTSLPQNILLIIKYLVYAVGLMVGI